MTRDAPAFGAQMRPLGEAFDLLAAYEPPAGFLFERRGRGVAGSTGAPTRIISAVSLRDLSRVVDVLRSLPQHGGGPPLVAAGAIPFSADRDDHHLVVPRRAVRRDEGVAWRIDLADLGGFAGDAHPFERQTGGQPALSFGQAQLRYSPSPDAYADAVIESVRRIRSGGLRKVVLARTIEVDAGRTLDPRRLAHRLRAVDPDTYTFAVPAGDSVGVLVGASPELLVSKRGREVRSNPLAGSAPRSGDAAEDRELSEQLQRSAKDREEHAIVVDAVAEVLRPFCERLRWDPEPVLLQTANVWHLSTRFHGVLREPSPSVLELVAALHPTPAVGGAPRAEALAAIAELEPFERGRYAGPVGWVDANGDGEWALALRCAELRGGSAILYAGAGIVAGSDPAAEVDETDRKFRAFLDALRWS